jgi:hypothetical protein
LATTDKPGSSETFTRIRSNSNGTSPYDSKGIRSTHKPTIEEIMEEEIEKEPELAKPRTNLDRKHYVGVESFKFEELKGISATDLPGRFPITSSQENAYGMVINDIDSNAIQAVPIKKQKERRISAWI